MRIQSLFVAAVMALAHQAIAAINIELYPNSENCTGRKIVLTTTGSQDVTIRGSTKVISGETFFYAGPGCTVLQTGAFTVDQGCFTTYPVAFSWYPVNR